MEIEPQIEREYIESRKVALVYKEFPLTSIHPGAVDYGLAAKCAQEQGKWREMHDKIFNEQNKLGVGTIPYSWRFLLNQLGLANSYEFMKRLFEYRLDTKDHLGQFHVFLVLYD